MIKYSTGWKENRRLKALSITTSFLFIIKAVAHNLIKTKKTPLNLQVKGV